MGNIGVGVKTTMSNAISMESVKKKLEKLPEEMLGEEQIVYDFASYLADQLNPKLYPSALGLSFLRAEKSFERGREVMTGKILDIDSEEYSQAEYETLEDKIPDIIEQVSPRGTTEDVLQTYQETLSDFKEF